MTEEEIANFVIYLTPLSFTAACAFSAHGTFPGAARQSGQNQEKEPSMLKWALIFLVISLITGFLGFSGVSAATATIARVLFAIALIVFLIFVVLAFIAGSAVV